MQKDIASRFIRDNFESKDRLAIVIVNKRSGSAIQRLATAEQIALPEFQAWLRYQNAQKADIYCTPNVLDEHARGRTKDDIQSIRHVYLDFDHQGTSAVERLRNHAAVPMPNYIVNTSPDKWQVLWCVEGFEKSQAEDLQRGMVREFGADPAATDCSRVLRVPGFYNHKYSPPHYVRAVELTRQIYTPEYFPKFEAEDRAARSASIERDPSTGLSQSERDWAYARRALARGESSEVVTTAIAQYRRDEKANVIDYAERTVRKAATSLAMEPSVEPDR